MTVTTYAVIKGMAGGYGGPPKRPRWFDLHAPELGCLGVVLFILAVVVLGLLIAAGAH